MTTDREPGPYERQLSAAFLRALTARARQPGPLPPYVPDSLHGYLLRVKSRHAFHQAQGGGDHRQGVGVFPVTFAA